MRKRTVIESGRDRRTLVADAGYSDLSLVSVLAGVLVAYGAFVVLASIVSGIITAADFDADISREWDRLSTAAGLAVAGVLFVSYLFGGYVAGRMARRAGVLHGALVFIFGLLLAAGVALLVRQVADPDTVANNLRDLGLPTTADEWADVGTIAGVASVIAMALGALFGGTIGERWHGKLLARALDPDVGAEAEYRRQAAEAAERANERHTGSQQLVGAASPATFGRRTDVADRTDYDGNSDADGDDRRAVYRNSDVDDRTRTVDREVDRTRTVNRDDDGIDDRAQAPVDRDNDGVDDRAQAPVDRDNDGVDDRHDNRVGTGLLRRRR